MNTTSNFLAATSKPVGKKKSFVLVVLENKTQEPGPAMVLHAFNPNTWEAEAGDL